jgi:methylenetetrahydrofolate--tRNA-(uracil-5-)-methyltransferase
MDSPREPVIVIGGGLAGAEAAWQCARRGVGVRLFEMRPARPTPVHRTGNLAELVCSNSFKSLEPGNAHALLKEEMTRCGSLILDCARGARVPAGAALAVDRERFASAVTGRLEACPGVEVVREEVTSLPEGGPAIVAAGPLVSEALAGAIRGFTGEDSLAFYDAIAPVIEADSLDRSIAFEASRYGKGEGSDYLNCPMEREDYERFYEALLGAAKADLHEIDRSLFFEGCLPVEEIALRGRDALRFGPMKPVGLRDPRTGRGAYAVVQLRQDNLAASHYSMVGFQNQLRWGEQKRIFRMIPGLERAEFVRLGMIHRNTYVNAPRILLETFQCRSRPALWFAGQISGVEGYTESTASGMIAGLGAVALLRGEAPPVFPPETALGSVQRYVAGADPEHYDPANFSFGLLPALDPPVRGKRPRRLAYRKRALESLERHLSDHPLPGDSPAGAASA